MLLSEKSILVSVIMNCHNSDKYLKESINSVYLQTYKNWEIIFIDNLSVDSSAKIAKSYGPKLKYYHSSKYLSLYKARNLALDKCSGSIITFLDCDDIWIKDKLSKQVDAYKKGYLFIFGDSQIVDAHLNAKSFIKHSKKRLKRVNTNSLIFRNTISIGCAAVDAKLIKKLKFDPFFELLGDFDMWIRLSTICTPIHLIGDLQLLSRDHEKNMSKTLKNRWLIERRYFYRKFISKNGFFKFPSIIKYIIFAEVKAFLRIF